MNNTSTTVMYVFLISVVILFLINKKRNGHKIRNTSITKRKSHDESFPKKLSAAEFRRKIKEIAGSISTIEDYKQCEAKLKQIEKVRMKSYSDELEEVIEQQYELYSEVLELADEKVILYQFEPDLDLSTPLSVLQYGYKCFSPGDYKSKKTALSKYGCWIEITFGGDEKESPSSNFKRLLKFREIVESSISPEEKILEIDALVTKSREFLDEFFDSNNELNPGEQWFVQSLEDDGLPLASTLYLEGYTTIEKCLEIAPEEFSKRKGVGPKKTQQLIDFQKKKKIVR
jgi:hypothetical protein